MDLKQLEEDAQLFCFMAQDEASIRASERVKVAVMELTLAEAFTRGNQYNGDDEGRWCRISPDELDVIYMGLQSITQGGSDILETAEKLRVEIDGLQDVYDDQMARDAVEGDGYDTGDMDTQELIGGNS